MLTVYTKVSKAQSWKRTSRLKFQETAITLLQVVLRFNSLVTIRENIILMSSILNKFLNVNDIR